MALHFEVTGAEELERLNRELARLGNKDRSVLVHGLTEEVAAQTQRRILHEKRGPSGRRWLDWSPRYARTRERTDTSGRHARHGLLVSEGHLLTDLYPRVEGDEGAVGTNLPYAARHQFGHENTPARPFLGFSDDNINELEDITASFMGGR